MLRLVFFFFSFVMKRCLDFCVCVDTAVLRRQGLSAHRPGWPCVMQLRTRRRDTTTHTYVRDTYVRAFRISVIILNRLIAWSLHAGAAPSYTTLFFFFALCDSCFFLHCDASHVSCDYHPPLFFCTAVVRHLTHAPQT